MTTKRKILNISVIFPLYLKKNKLKFDIFNSNNFKKIKENF